MSLEDKRWAQRARDLRMHQLEPVRKQAEGWRVGLAGTTALLSAVLVVKGKDTVTGLESWARWSVALLLATAFALLVTATVVSVRAASGRPGSEILLTGENLKAWTEHEAGQVGVLIRRAAVMTVCALVLVGASVGITWLAPDAKADKPLVEVIGPHGRLCGELIGTADGQLIVKDDELSRTAFDELISVAPVASCPKKP